MTAKTAKKEDSEHPKEPFEKSLERLESIVRRLETGEEGLEDSLKLFEDGAKLSASLTTRLDEVKQKVEVLVKEGKDRFKSKPLDSAD